MQRASTFLLVTTLCLCWSTAGCGGDGPGAAGFPGQWSEPLRIAGVGGGAFGLLDQVDAGLAENGSALLLWYQPESVTRPPSGTLWWSRWDGAAWSPGQRLSASVIDFALTSAPDGTAAAAWLQWSTPAGAGRSLILGRYAPERGWSTIHTARSPIGQTRGWLAGPGIALDARGNALSVWHYRDRASLLFTSLWPAGASPEPPGQLAGLPHSRCLINPHPIGKPYQQWAFDSRIGFDGGGNAIVVWLQDEDPLSDSSQCVVSLWSARFEAGTGWSSPARVFEPRFANWFANLAVGQGGSAAVIGLHGDPDKDPLGSMKIVVSRYDPGAGWAGESLLGDTDGIGRPGIAVDDQGNALAVFSASGNGQNTRPHIAFARSTPGQSWTQGAVAELEADDAQAVPDLAMDAGGRAVAVWRQAQGPAFRILAALYQDGQWSKPVALSTNEAGVLADRPVIAMTHGGRALVVWQQSRTVPDMPAPEITLWSSRYEPGP